MRRLIKPLFWTTLFLVILLAIDQLLVQVPPLHPAHAAVSTFYRDFRGRLFALVLGDASPAPQSIEAVIAREQTGAATPADQQSPAAVPKRYVYVDSEGTLQFADTLEEVPLAYRQTAEPLSE